jgi:hypothetical protein
MVTPKVKARRPMTQAAFRRRVKSGRGKYQGGGALKMLVEERAREREREEREAHRHSRSV